MRRSVHTPLSPSMQAKAAREKERALAIRDGLIPDPNRRRRLEDASNLIGTCPDMCPEYERVEREFQHAVDKWELVRPLVGLRSYTLSILVSPGPSYWANRSVKGCQDFP